MKIGIVGANSQVGTELAVLCAERGDVSVVPIVRNRLGTHFLRHLGIDCEVADITDDVDAASALADLDVVVIAAFAWQYSQEGFEARGARKANEGIVRHAVDHASSDARIVYFSSQAAFGDEIGAPQYSDWSLYTREKLNAETILRKRCESAEKAGFVFRLGFVHGPNQTRTAEVKEAVSDHSHVHLAVDPEKESNVVHTITLLDAILQCAKGEVSPGTYSIVNEPQWTWREVCEYYKPDDVTVHYHPPDDDRGYSGEVLSHLWSAIESRQRTLRTATVYVPDAINEYLFHKYLQQQRGGELAALRDRITVERPAFQFDPVPGPFIGGLPDTRDRLDALEAVGDAFELEDQR